MTDSLPTADQQKQLSDSQLELIAAHATAAAEAHERLEALQGAGEATARELQQVVTLGQRLRLEQSDTLAAVERVRAHQQTHATMAEAALEAQERLSAQQVRHAEADRTAHARLQEELAQAALTSAAARATLEELGQAHVRETNEAREALAALTAAAAETHRRQERLSEVLTRVESVQGVLAAEFLDTHRVAFWASAFALLILLTAARRLAAVRLPGLLLLCVCFALERNHSPYATALGAVGIHLAWLIRGAFGACITLMFAAQAWRYQDEATRLRQLVSDQTQQALARFFATATTRASRCESVEGPVKKRPASRTPRRRLLTAAD